MNQKTPLPKKGTAKTHIRELALIFQQAHEYWDSLSTDQRQSLIKSAKRRTNTNCWWAEFDAARWVMRNLT